jgi:hypothetical protein
MLDKHDTGEVMAGSLKKCFIVSPIGADGSDIRIAADFFREDVVRAALSADFTIKRADDYSEAGNITSQVIQAIANADLIVADLTGRNANVYYELGVAHSYKIHVVPMISDVEPLPIPFDNYMERTISYSLKTVETRKRAQERLAATVKATLDAPVSNPVTTALGLEKVAASGDDPGQLMVAITNQLAVLARRLESQEAQMKVLTHSLLPQPYWGSRSSQDGGLFGQESQLPGRNALARGRTDFLTGTETAGPGLLASLLSDDKVSPAREPESDTPGFRPQPAPGLRVQATPGFGGQPKDKKK